MVAAEQQVDEWRDAHVLHSLVNSPRDVVEAVAAVGPRQRVLHPGKRVEQSPGDDHVVVECYEKRHEQHAVAKAPEGRSYAAKELVGPHTAILPNRQLEEEERQPGEGQHARVGDQESASSVLVAEVGEAPHVAQAHRVAQAGEEEIALVVPVASLILVQLLRLLLVLVLAHDVSFGVDLQEEDSQGTWIRVASPHLYVCV